MKTVGLTYQALHKEPAIARYVALYIDPSSSLHREATNAEAMIRGMHALLELDRNGASLLHHQQQNSPAHNVGYNGSLEQLRPPLGSSAQGLSEDASSLLSD